MCMLRTIAMGLLWLVWPWHFAQAAPLDTLPVIEEDRLRVNLSTRSDLWTSVYEDKNSPLRLYDFNFRVPLDLKKKWVGAASVSKRGTKPWT
jgi:hypothetical protein